MGCYQCGSELVERHYPDATTNQVITVLSCPDPDCPAVF